MEVVHHRRFFSSGELFLPTTPEKTLHIWYQLRGSNGKPPLTVLPRCRCKAVRKIGAIRCTPPKCSIKLRTNRVDCFGRDWRETGVREGPKRLFWVFWGFNDFGACRPTLPCIGVSKIRRNFVFIYCCRQLTGLNGSGGLGPPEI